jgi:colanic acid/amylovoran biosynthesis glycosyltransferase
MTGSAPPTVGHFRTRYLPLTETFIYQYLTNYSRYDPFMCSLTEENVDKFPFQPRETLSTQPVWQPKRWWYDAVHRTKLDAPFYGEIIDRRDPELIHAHFGPTGAALSKYRTPDRPLVTTFYGYDTSEVVTRGGTAKQRLKRQYYLRLYRRLFDAGDLFLIEGPAMKEKLVRLGCPEGKVALQRIAIDTDRIEPSYPSGEPPLTVLMVGRFVEKKGMPDGIRAFASTFRDTDTELRIIGDEGVKGYSETDLRTIAENRDVLDQVTFTGFLDYEAYLDEVHSCDLLLAPSKVGSRGDSEGGAPTVLLEAQAAGKPVVSTSHADIPYVVADEETGLLSRPGDVKGLADALTRFRDDPDLFGEFGRRGRSRMERRHDIDRLAPALEAKYDRIRG